MRVRVRLADKTKSEVDRESAKREGRLRLQLHQAPEGAAPPTPASMTQAVRVPGAPPMKCVTLFLQVRTRSLLTDLSPQFISQSFSLFLFVGQLRSIFHCSATLYSVCAQTQPTSPPCPHPRALPNPTPHIADKMADKLTRIAIVNSHKCKPKKCRQECQ